MTVPRCPDCGFRNKDAEIVFQHVMAKACAHVARPEPEWVRRARLRSLPVKIHA